MEDHQGALTGHCYHLHGLSSGKKKELTALIEDNGGTVTYIFGKTVPSHPLTLPTLPGPSSPSNA